jgi:hypothetical protein
MPFTEVKNDLKSLFEKGGFKLLQEIPPTPLCEKGGALS